MGALEPKWMRLRQKATTKGVGLEDKWPLPALEPNGRGSQAHGTRHARHTQKNLILSP